MIALRQVQEHVRRGLAGEALLGAHRPREPVIQPAARQQRHGVLHGAMGGQIVPAPRPGQGRHGFRDPRHGRDLPRVQHGLRVVAAEQLLRVQAVFPGKGRGAVGQASLHQPHAPLQGKRNPHGSCRPHHRRGHGGIGVHHRAVKVPEQLRHRRLRQGQLPRHRRVPRAEGVAQQLPGGNEGAVLMLGQHGGVGRARRQEGEQDALRLPQAQRAHLRHRQGQLLRQLPHKARRRVLARLLLAPGEFPQVGVVPPLAPPADQDAPVLPADDPGRYPHHAQPSLSMAISAA